MSVWGGESIHNAILSSLTSAPTGKKICKLEFTWNPDGTIAAIKFLGENNELLFTLSFVWNPDGTLQSLART